MLTARKTRWPNCREPAFWRCVHFWGPMADGSYCVLFRLVIWHGVFLLFWSICHTDPSLQLRKAQTIACLKCSMGLEKAMSRPHRHQNHQRKTWNQKTIHGLIFSMMKQLTLSKCQMVHQYRRDMCMTAPDWLDIVRIPEEFLVIPQTSGED